MAISGWGVFIIIVIVVVILGGGGYVLYTHWRARRLGLPAPNFNPFNRRSDNAPYRTPAPAPSGIQGWFQDKWQSLRGGNNQRMAGGAYESTGYGAGGRHSLGGGGSRRGRGFGPLDPDEAWDARVDHEPGGYYEEQELGLQDPSQAPYGGGGYGGSSAHVGVGGLDDGWGRQRELDGRYEEEVHGGRAPRSNPFGDEHEASNASLRSVSPRPAEGTGNKRGVSAHQRGQASLGTLGSAEDSPTERRSMFRENM